MVVQKEDSTIQQINRYSLDSAISFPNTYPLDIDLSSGYRYLMFEQPDLVSYILPLGYFT